MCDRHTRALGKRCRICAALEEDADCKTEYEAQLANEYNILIRNDDKRIHGAKICSTCVKILSEKRKGKRTKKFVDFYRLFGMHHGPDNYKDPKTCEICNERKINALKRKSVEGTAGQEKRPKYLETTYYGNVLSMVCLLPEEERADLLKEMNRSATCNMTYKEKINLLSSEEQAKLKRDIQQSFTSDEIVSMINSLSPKERVELVNKIRVPISPSDMIVTLIKSLDGMQKKNFSEKLPQCLTDTFENDHYINLVLQLMKSQLFTKIINNMSNENQNLLAFALAKAQYTPISQDMQTNIGRLRDFHENEMGLNEWVEKRNSVCKNFLKGILAGKVEVSKRASSMNVAQLAFTMEAMYNIASIKFVGPLSFNVAFNIYCLTSSKTAVDILSKLAPCGSYQNMLRWLDKQNAISEKCPLGTVLNVFDNEQTIGRKSGVAVNNQSKCSVITTVVHAKLSDERDIQNRKELKPTPIAPLDYYDVQIEQLKKANIKNPLSIQYLEKKRKELEDAVQRLIDEPPEWDVITKYKKIHDTELDSAIEKALEQEMKQGSNEIDQRVKKTLELMEARKMLTCVDCKKKYHVKKIVCDFCKSSIGIAKYKKEIKDKELEESFRLPKEEKTEYIIVDSDDEDAGKDLTSEKSGQYMHVESNHKGPAKLTVSEPVLVNPNGYEGINAVLKKIAISNGIAQYHEYATESAKAENRKWTFVACDGAPHVLIQNLMRDTVLCNKCNKQLKKKEFDGHHAKSHSQEGKAEYFHEFDWIYLIEGMFVYKSFKQDF